MTLEQFAVVLIGFRGIVGVGGLLQEAEEDPGVEVIRFLGHVLARIGIGELLHQAAGLIQVALVELLARAVQVEFGQGGLRLLAQSVPGYSLPTCAKTPTAAS